MTARSTADARLPLVVEAALKRFARTGYYATTIADVAHEADLSPAYISKLFGAKEHLFVAALTACFDRVLDALGDGADAAPSTSPEDLLDGMGEAYAALISDRSVLLMQVHAQSVADNEAIGTALRLGIERVTTFARERSLADDISVQRFMAYGQLCHLIVASRLDEADNAPWSRVLTAGIKHP